MPRGTPPNIENYSSQGLRNFYTEHNAPRGTTTRPGARFYSNIVFDELAEPTTAGWAFETGDETTSRDIRIGEFKFKKNVVKEIKIDKETYAAILSITDELLAEDLAVLKEIHEKRLDFIDRKDYTAIIGSYTIEEDEEHEESIRFHRLQNTQVSFALLAQGAAIPATSGQVQYLKHLEDRAQERYNIEYSVYKYYPRLKSKVKYGDADLLSKILAVTQIGKGKVICPRP